MCVCVRYTLIIDSSSITISYQINLSAFKDTLMELNKNIYFGDNIIFTINWNAFNKMGFTTTAVVAANVLTGAIAFTIAPSISNLFLYTCYRR